jgi:hypothetical protein
MEGFFVAKVTHEGWYSSSDEIPQPISVVMGANLRKQPAPLSEAERVLQSIAEFCEAQKKLEESK